MIDSLIIMFREGLEAALIIAIILVSLYRIEQRQFSRYVWIAVIAAILASVVVALPIYVFYGGLEGTIEEVFEGVMMIFAVVVLTYVLLCMCNQVRNIFGGLRKSVPHVISDMRVWGLALLAGIYLILKPRLDIE